MARGYIPDGYTIDGYIAGVEGLYDDFRFRYRPMSTNERQQLLGENGRLQNPAKVVENMCKAVASRIPSWDLTHPESEEKIPVSWKVLQSNMVPALYDKVVNIVLGFEPSSPDPLKEAKEPTLEESKVEDKLIGDVMLENQQKN